MGALQFWMSNQHSSALTCGTFLAGGQRKSFDSFRGFGVKILFLSVLRPSKHISSVGPVRPSRENVSNHMRHLKVLPYFMSEFPITASSQRIPIRRVHQWPRRHWLPKKVADMSWKNILTGKESDWTPKTNFLFNKNLFGFLQQALERLQHALQHGRAERYCVFPQYKQKSLLPVLLLPPMKMLILKQRRWQGSSNSLTSYQEGPKSLLSVYIKAK